MSDDFDPSDYRDRSQDADEFAQVGSDDSTGSNQQKTDDNASSSGSGGTPRTDDLFDNDPVGEDVAEQTAEQGGGDPSNVPQGNGSSSSAESKTTKEATQEATRDQGIDDPDAAPANAPDPDSDRPRGARAGDGDDDAPGAPGDGLNTDPNADNFSGPTPGAAPWNTNTSEQAGEPTQSDSPPSEDDDPITVGPNETPEEAAADRFDERTPGVDITHSDVVVSDGEVRLTEQARRRVGASQLDEDISATDVTASDVIIEDGKIRLNESTREQLAELRQEQLEESMRDPDEFAQPSASDADASQIIDERDIVVPEASDRVRVFDRRVIDDDTTATQETLAEQELERRLEEETGAELESGEDFTVEQTDDGFTAEVTEQGQEKIERQIQQEELSSTVGRAEDLLGEFASEVAAANIRRGGNQELAGEARDTDVTVDIPGEGPVATKRGPERFDTAKPLPGEQLAEDFEATAVKESNKFGEKIFSEEVAGESLIAETFRAAGEDKLADQSDRAVRSFGQGLVTAPGALVGKAATIPYDVVEFGATASQQSLQETGEDLASSATEAAVAGAAGFARDPATTSGAIVGSAALSGGVFRATQGTRAGTAARITLQPGEEIVKAGIRRGVFGRRAARVTPGVRIGQVRGTEAESETKSPSEAAQDADSMDLVKDLPDERPVTLESEAVDQAQGTTSPSRTSVIRGKTKRTASRLSERISEEIGRLEVKTRVGAGPGAVEIERETESEAPAAPSEFDPQTRRRATEPQLTDDRVSDNLLQQSIDQQLRRSRAVRERGTFEGEPRPFARSETQRRRQEIESRQEKITRPTIETETETELSGERAGLLGAIVGAGATSTELTSASAEIGSMAGAASETETGGDVDTEIESAIDTETELDLETETEFEQELELETEREQELERERERERERELERELEAVSPDLKSREEPNFQSFESDEYERTFSSDIKDPEEVLTDLTGSNN